MDPNELQDKRLLRYTRQPSSLPPNVAARISAACNEPVALYALADLDESLHMVERWFALTPNWCCHLATGNGEAPSLFRRDDVKRVELVVGLSCCQLILRGLDDSAPLAVLRFSQRQRPAMEGVSFLELRS